MDKRKILKLIHLLSTIWLMVCLGIILVTALRQAGFNWWVIFSLSGQSAVVTFLLVSLYLFALFGAAGKGQRIAVEHPLTSTWFYMAFYVSAPLLGAAGGVLAITEMPKITQLFSLMALGTFTATFLTWIIVDPVATMLESIAPVSRAHRLQRLAADKLQREKQQHDREAQLSMLFAQQEQDRLQWKKILIPDAEKLTELLRTDRANYEQAENQAVDIGVRAWRIGGFDCMRQLRDMSLELCRDRYGNLRIIDHIPNWWDGIGNWRIPAAG